MTGPVRATLQRRTAPVAPPVAHRGLTSPGRPLEPGVRGE